MTEDKLTRKVLNIMRKVLNSMRKRLAGEWSGWDGETLVTLFDGSRWQQDEYYYEYRYSFMPWATIEHGKMLVDGMNRAVRVRRID
ncbi:hypothetical protein [Curtobacterium sp. MCBA15_004]|uniref:hypothetical protein n=1 Tax=Curtobacterium sp. MCBA15_004 TaxID=1898733 RepID=UPI0008DE3173|nr:hypothetical protein [Curtobacterium sp. MCBA15_004]WIA97024.1 hypothetical protein QOL16_01145 [Curtobacterium sp. MCBA15_004]